MFIRPPRSRPTQAALISITAPHLSRKPPIRLSNMPSSKPCVKSLAGLPQNPDRMIRFSGNQNALNHSRGCVRSLAQKGLFRVRSLAQTYKPYTNTSIDAQITASSLDADSFIKTPTLRSVLPRSAPRFQRGLLRSQPNRLAHYFKNAFGKHLHSINKNQNKWVAPICLQKSQVVFIEPRIAPTEQSERLLKRVGGLLNTSTQSLLILKPAYQRAHSVNPARGYDFHCARRYSGRVGSRGMSIFVSPKELNSGSGTSQAMCWTSAL